MIYSQQQLLAAIDLNSNSRRQLKLLMLSEENFDYFCLIFIYRSNVIIYAVNETTRHLIRRTNTTILYINNRINTIYKTVALYAKILRAEVCSVCFIWHLFLVTDHILIFCLVLALYTKCFFFWDLGSACRSCIVKKGSIWCWCFSSRLSNFRTLQRHTSIWQHRQAHLPISVVAVVLVDFLSVCWLPCCYFYLYFCYLCCFAVCRVYHVVLLLEGLVKDRNMRSWGWVGVVCNMYSSARHSLRPQTRVEHVISSSSTDCNDRTWLWQAPQILQ